MWTGIGSPVTCGDGTRPRGRAADRLGGTEQHAAGLLAVLCDGEVEHRDAVVRGDPQRLPAAARRTAAAVEAAVRVQQITRSEHVAPTISPVAGSSCRSAPTTWWRVARVQRPRRVTEARPARVKAGVEPHRRTVGRVNRDELEPPKARPGKERSRRATRREMSDDRGARASTFGLA
jgi:hypothetical protein